MIPDISKELARLYLDKCDIYRYTDVKNGPFSNWEDAPIHSGLYCGYSKGSQTIVEDDVRKKVEQPKLFLPPNTDILEGDKLIIYPEGSDRSIAFKVGTIFPYVSHIEVNLKGEVYE